MEAFFHSLFAKIAQKISIYTKIIKHNIIKKLPITQTLRLLHLTLDFQSAYFATDFHGLFQYAKRLHLEVIGSEFLDFPREISEGIR